MVDLPWQRDSQRHGDIDTEDIAEGDPIVTCEFQDGTLIVYEGEISIERPSRSKFDDKRIPIPQVRTVTYAQRFVISYIQIEQDGFDHSSASRLSTPVDENTLHFGRGKRSCAKRARDLIFDQMG